MQLHVDVLTGSPETFSESESPDWLRELGTPLAPLRAEVTAHRMPDDEIYLEGRLEALLELECGRCLARYRHALREAFRLVLEPAGARVPADPEAAEALARDGMCLGDEIETGWYRGPEIDLSRYFREVVMLGLPVQPLCRESCAGLCPRCGADRNAAACDCKEIRTDSPFAVLGALRGGETRGDS